MTGRSRYGGRCLPGRRAAFLEGPPAGGRQRGPATTGSRSLREVRGRSGGLPTLRIEARLLADLPNDWEEHDAGYYTDRNYEDRIGWREIVVRGGPGVAIENSTAPSADASNELRSYPQDSPPAR